METRGPPRVKNKAAAPIQISAEQLLREAVDRQDEKQKAPTQRIESHEELLEMQGRKRKEFEDYIRRNRQSINNFLRYAEWEASQKEMRRARSVMERALDTHSTNVVIWLRYIDLEAKNGNVQHGRNVINRATVILPRISKIWYKGVYMEETLGNISGARELWERWLQWEPEADAWSGYIKMELRYGEIDKARGIFERFVQVHPEPKNWIKFARFEEANGTADLVRDVYASAVETLGDDFADEKLFMAWARYEATTLGDTERARAIYKLALDRMPRSRSMNLQKAWTKFEKQYGDKDGVENVILSKRRRHYEELVSSNPKNYDAWIDFAALEEASCSASGDMDHVREIYERAISQIPPSSEKRHWRRYIFLFLFYCVFEEVVAKDIERTRQIYQQCIGLLPHKSFTFSKVWLMAAEFEIRQGNLTAARKLLGRGIGMCPKDKIFRGYIEMEMKLFEFNRVRQLYSKYLEWDSSIGSTWIKFAELERGLDDLDRSRAIFEMAIEEPQIDMPELVWKAYIDFEESEGEYARGRALYERLLQKTDHVKVWTSWAQFEIGVPDDDDDSAAADDEDRPISESAKARARAVFDRAHKRLKEKELKEDRVALLNAWRSFEAVHGSKEDQENIEKQMPRKVKKRRKLDDDSFEEYVDYVFPADDESAAKLAKLMANAQKWKQAKAAQQAEN